MMAEYADFLRPLVRSVIQEFLEAEMAVAIGAEKGERVEGRLSASKRLLSAQLDYPGRQARVERLSARPQSAWTARGNLRRQ
jgi:transposase-like protein